MARPQKVFEKGISAQKEESQKEVLFTTWKWEKKYTAKIPFESF